MSGNNLRHTPLVSVYTAIGNEWSSVSSGGIVLIARRHGEIRDSISVLLLPFLPRLIFNELLWVDCIKVLPREGQQGHLKISKSILKTGNMPSTVGRSGARSNRWTQYGNITKLAFTPNFRLLSFKHETISFTADVPNFKHFDTFLRSRLVKYIATKIY